MLTSYRPGGETQAEAMTPKIEQVEVNSTFGRFVVEPLEAGFGTTLGNALRRVLLGSLPGAAVTAVKIDQVQHEFSSIPHVREDTVEFLLNVKKLRLQAFSDRSGRLALDKQGPGVVTAADIVVHGDFQIVNPELYLATLDSAEARLSVDFTVEHGKGYVPAGAQSEGHTIGVIPVDAIYTPIRKVNYVVETVRIGVTNYDRLILEMWTDGTIQPLEALNKAAKILMTMLGIFASVPPTFVGPAVRDGQKTPALPPSVYDQPIEVLELSVRTYNALKRAGITKIGTVVEMSDEDLKAIRNFGQKSLDELRDKLVERGYIAGSDKPSEDVELDMFGNPIVDPDDMDDEE